MRRKRIYISGPMSQGDWDRNIAQGIAVFRQLLGLRKYSTICPHLSGLMPGCRDIPNREWYENDLGLVEVMDAVIRLPGPSVGADMECDIAVDRGIVIVGSVEEAEEHFARVG